MTCLNCKTDKPDIEFYPDGDYPLWSHYCFECRRSTVKEIIEQYKKQTALLSVDEKKKLFTVITSENIHLRKMKLPDWIIIDQPGF